MEKIFVGEVNGEEIKDGSIVLINVPAGKLAETNSNILKWYVTKKNYDVVYVTVNKPFSDLIERFKIDNIDINKIFVIDSVTQQKVTDISRTGNAVFIGSPKELTNISITTTSTIEKLNTAKILFLDSVSTLLFYNDFETVKDFIHFISKKMKDLKVTFTMICIKDLTDEKVISQLSSFVDVIIEVE